MNKTVTRLICIILAAILCLGLLAGIIPTSAAGTVTYKYASNDDYSGIILNWGERGVDATFLSPNAESFYAENQVTYEDLALLSGSSNTSSVPSSALYLQLQELMADNHTTKTSYGELRYLFAYTDCETNNSATISELYTGDHIYSTWDGGSTFNREHCWPKSKTSTPSVSNSTRGEATDLMTLRPADPSINSSRGNKAYGTTTDSDYFYPNEHLDNYDLRGDVARIMLYTYVRWGNTSNMWGSSGVIQSKDVLLQWVEEDPVDTWELARNDSVESVTGTRNVFVDFPELVFLLFNEEIPSDMTTPSCSGGGVAYTISAQSSNVSYGTVSLSGNVITAVPAEGYQASGYTVTSGTATVTQNGNSFTVKASSDCVIMINFEVKQTADLIFIQNGQTVSVNQVYRGESFAMPAYQGTAPDSYTFVGWVNETVDGYTKPATVYAAGSTYSVTGDKTFYALYSMVDAGSGDATQGDVFEKYTGTLTEGDYLIVYDSESGALKAEVSDKNRFNYEDVTITDGQIETTDETIIWHIAPYGSYFTIYNESVGKYAGGNGTKNKGALLSSVTDYAKWTPSGTSSYELVNLGNENKGVNSNLRKNGEYGFACYSTSIGGALTLYKRTAGVTYYYTTGEEPIDSTIVYVSQSAGSDTNSGLYEARPLATLDAAYAKLETIVDQGEFGTIVLLDTYAITEDSLELPGCDFLVVITSKTGAEGLQYSPTGSDQSQRYIAINGQTTLTNLTITYTQSTFSLIKANGHKLTIGADVTTVATTGTYLNIIGGTYGEGVETESTELSICSGTWQNVYAGGYDDVVDGSTNLYMENCTVIGGIYAGGCGESDVSADVWGDAYMTLGEGVAAGAVYAGSQVCGEMSETVYIVADGVDLSTIAVYGTCQGEGSVYRTILRLEQGVANAVTFDANLILDLNGNDVTGAVTVENGVLGVMDSQTDDFTVADGIYGQITGTVTGKLVAAQGYVAVDGQSFHRFVQRISGVSVRPSITGIYYRAVWKCDEVLAAQITSFGVAVSTLDMPTDTFNTTDEDTLFTAFGADEFVSGQEKTSVMIKNILATGAANDTRGKTKIYAACYVILADGTKMVSTTPVAYSLYDVMHAAEDSSSYTQNADALNAFYTTWESVMKEWGFDKIGK